MGLFLDYMELVPKFFENPGVIAEGWLNDIKLEYGNLPEDQVKEIFRRRAICYECPLMSNNVRKDQSSYKELMGKDFTNKRQGEFCTICHCPIKKKTASLDSECGITESEQTKLLEPKWKAYGKTI